MKFPDMRSELIDYLSGLSNKDYQDSCWVKKRCPEGVENDELDYAVHFLFDDTCLSESPEDLIGILLKNEDEAHAIKTVCSAIDDLFLKYGCDKSDKEYINYPEWNNVVISACKAISIIK